MKATPIVAAVLVTHNSEEFLTETLGSIDKQTREPNLRIAVDDLSIDSTLDVLADHGFTVQRATSTSTDAITRIAQNFQQGLRAAVAAGADVVVLGDHDDVWHRNRIEHQLGVLTDFPWVAMLASDGFLIDEHGAAVAGTIRNTFPVPVDFDAWPIRKRLGYAARHSLATGGSSALRPAALKDWSVPAGWLHDRWWSLVALRADALMIDPTQVIDYRISPEQQVGLEAGGQDTPVRWLASKARNLGTTGTRLRAVSRLIKS